MVNRTARGLRQFFANTAQEDESGRKPGAVIDVVILGTEIVIAPDVVSLAPPDAQVLGVSQSNAAAHRKSRTVLLVCVAWRKATPSSQTVHEDLNVLAGKTQYRTYERFIRVVEFAKVGAGIHRQTKPLVEKVGDVNHESPTGILEPEGGGKT